MKDHIFADFVLKRGSYIVKAMKRLKKYYNLEKAADTAVVTFKKMLEESDIFRKLVFESLSGKDWDRWKELHQIRVPTLLVVGRYDTMSVQDVQKMGRIVPNSRVFVCRNGSHLSMYDDQQTYFHQITKFIKEVKTNRFGKSKNAR